MVSAKVHIEGSFDEALKEGAKVLNDYVEGSNLRITKISGCGPIIQTHKANHWEINLLFPKGMALIDAPKPISRLIKLEEIPPCRVGVLKFLGVPTQENFQLRAEELSNWLFAHGAHPIGSLRVSRNDHCALLPFISSNEVYLDVGQ